MRWNTKRIKLLVAVDEIARVGVAMRCLLNFSLVVDRRPVKADSLMRQRP